VKRKLLKINAFIKGLVFAIKPHIFLGWLRKPLSIMSNTLSLTKWMSLQDRKGILNDFYTAKRDYSKRYILYKYVSDTLNLRDTVFDYIEFGVAGGYSFRWWVSNSLNRECRFYGFDTFEGLPEAWGTFNKSDMAAEVPVINDNRVKFVKGLFQNTLPDFLKEHNMKNGSRKIIHLDADLFSSTLYALTILAPFMKSGDILIFDEFNVPNHEFLAFRIFCDSYYIKTKLIGAVNNYLQVAFVIE
jgi:O-methyltransferase